MLASSIMAKGHETSLSDEKNSLRQEIEETLDSARSLIKSSLKPLPTQSGDGTYITPPQVTGLIKDLPKMGLDDAATLIELVKTTATGQKIDDKSYFMERLIKLASALPLTSKNGTMITTSLVTKLWSDLQHPPSTFLGEEYNYRRADGSYNVCILCSVSFLGVGGGCWGTDSLFRMLCSLILGRLELLMPEPSDL